MCKITLTMSIYLQFSASALRPRIARPARNKAKDDWELGIVIHQYSSLNSLDITSTKLSLSNFDSLLASPQSMSIATVMSTWMRTRSTAVKMPEEDLTYSISDAILQMKAEVQKVYDANANTEKKVESFTGYLDITKVALLSSYIYILFTILVHGRVQ
jgi:hypothetical protein